VFGSWALLVRALLVRALLVLVVASSGPGGFRLMRLLRVVAGELWLASYPFSCGQLCRVHAITKQGTLNFIAEGRYILATISLKFRV
jgi:hypothetical protein